jgi:hypothetical protein
MDLHRRRSVLVGLVFGVVASLSDWLAASRGVTFTWKQYKTHWPNNATAAHGHSASCSERRLQV